MRALTLLKNLTKNMGYHRKELALVAKDLRDLRAYADRLENTIEIQRLKIAKLEAKE